MHVWIARDRDGSYPEDYLPIFSSPRAADEYARISRLVVSCIEVDGVLWSGGPYRKHTGSLDDLTSCSQHDLGIAHER